MTATSLLVAAILTATPSGRDSHLPFSSAIPVERLPPGPIVVESAPDPPAGVVRIEPGVAPVRAHPGQSVQPEFLITNGANAPLDLGLTVAPVVPAPDGTPRVTLADEKAASAAPSAAGWVALPAPGLHLDPGEQARLRPTISLPSQTEPGGYVSALRAVARADSSDASHETPAVAAFLLVEVPGLPGETTPGIVATPGLARSGLTGAEARVRLDTEQSRVVAGRLTVGGWWGATLVDVPIPPTVVLRAAPRTQQVSFRAPVLPGPYDLVASLETASGELLTARTTAWLWNPLATAIVLLVLLMVAAPVLLRAAVHPGHRDRGV